MKGVHRGWRDLMFCLCICECENSPTDVDGFCDQCRQAACDDPQITEDGDRA